MSTAEYFNMIVSILIGLTMITIILLFFYMIHGEEEKESFRATKFSEISDRILSINLIIMRLLTEFP